MQRLILWLLFFTLALGAPYAAQIIASAQGPWSADGIEHDGSITHMEFDRGLTPPSWLPILPDADLVQASHLINAKQGRDYTGYEYSSRQPVETIRDFYLAGFRRAGFKVIDLGTGPLNKPAADFVGVADQLAATRKRTGDQVSVMIGTPEGILGARSVKLGLYKISAAL